MAIFITKMSLDLVNPISIGYTGGHTKVRKWQSGEETPSVCVSSLKLNSPKGVRQFVSKIKIPGTHEEFSTRM
jgi:hypothetical protein